jgi:predicted permease
VEPGFRREGVLLAAYDLTGRDVDDAGARAFAARLLERLREIPGMESAAIASSVPLDIHGLPIRSFVLEGRVRSDGAPDRISSNIVSPGYFDTMRIPLRAGRDFVPLTDGTTPRQVIVNQEFVRRYSMGVTPLGHRLESGGRSYTIAGVAQNSLYDAFGEPPTPVVYFSYRDRPLRQGEIHLRTRADATLAAPGLQRAIHELDPTLPLYDVRTLTEHIEKHLFLRRIPARMFAVLGPLLLLLVAIGTYSVVAYAVSHRTAEIGVRLALGATTRRVVTEIVRDSLRVIGAGALAGWFIALLIGVHLTPNSIDPVVFLAVPALLLSVATVACWVPARRASRTDP